MAETGMIDANDEEAVLARAAQIQGERARQVREERVAAFAPLLAVVDGEGWTALRDSLPALRQREDVADNTADLIRSLLQLRDLLAAQIPADARPAA